MADALAAVKKDLGPDAVILHTRTVKSGGLIPFDIPGVSLPGLSPKSTVEITATDDPRAGRATRKPPSQQKPSDQPRITNPLAAAVLANDRSVSDAHARPDRAAPETPPAREHPQPQPTPTYQRPTPPSPPTPTRQHPQGQDQPGAFIDVKQPKPIDDDAAEVLRVRKRRVSQLATPVEFNPESRHGSDQIAKDLADIKLLVSHVLRSRGTDSPGAPSSAPGMPSAVLDHYTALLDAGVERALADTLVESVREELGPGESSDTSIVRTALLRHLGSRLPCARATHQPPSPNTATVITLVGPTGVGKTTTIAKLAANYKLRHGRSVGLITCDTYRIAAVDQLRTYASIIGLPLQVVLSASEMRSAIAAARHEHEVVIIDTAGRSQFNTDRLDELAQTLGQAQPDQTHLVLSATTSESVMRRSLDAFAVLEPDRVIFTKLDEAETFGPLLNTLDRANQSRTDGHEPLRVSFLTTGQEVPDQIEPANPDRLARLILDGHRARHRSPRDDHSPHLAKA